ncbi:MAG: hypothetical protein KDE66_11050, partial [Nitrosomonas sp.]|nr:hypothetical protein [Nitrosomonas sp.]
MFFFIHINITLSDSRASQKIQILSQHFVAHKKCFLTYQSHVASTFFAHASFCLKLRISRDALSKTQKTSNTKIIRQSKVTLEDLPIETLQHVLHHVFGELFRAVKYSAQIV